MTSKPGKHGTLYIDYSDDCEGGYAASLRTWAYDLEHAKEKFEESEDADGWRIDSIVRVTV